MRVLTAVSLATSLAVSAALLVIPVYSGTTTETVVDPGSDSARLSVTERYSTLLAVNGPRVLFPLAFPVLVALVPLIVPLRAFRAGAAILLGGFCMLGGFSIGLLYIPSAVTMFLAALWHESR